MLDYKISHTNITNFSLFTFYKIVKVIDIRLIVMRGLWYEINKSNNLANMLKSNMYKDRLYPDKAEI